MNAVELSRLEALTKDYAAFQARKSGLATALGGLMALLLIVVPMNLDFSKFFVGGRPLMEVMLFTPLVWLLAKLGLGRWFYRGLGTVKAVPDIAAERRRWHWIFGLSLFVVGFLIFCLWGFMAGVLVPGPFQVPPDHPQIEGYPASWVIGLPLLYLAAAPWLVRGLEEARAYAVLVAQSTLWITEVILFRFLSRSLGPASTVATTVMFLGFLSFVALVFAWASLAMIRGWREHREYLGILRGLPAGEGE